MAPESKDENNVKRYNPAGVWLAIGLTFGTAIGLIYGYAIDNVTLGLVLGGGGGMLIGLSIGASIKNSREDSKK